MKQVFSLSEQYLSSGGSLPQRYTVDDVLSLKKNLQGQLELSLKNQQSFVPVIPVRAFPITGEDAGFSLMDEQGHEIIWIAQLSDLPPEFAFVFKEELLRRDFMPVIQAIRGVSSYLTPCQWQVDTDRGTTRFTLKGEEDIRRLGSGALLITDLHGINYLIREVGHLDKTSKKILDRFL